MILADKHRSLAEGDKRALWYVTNGKAVVGPVATDLLLRGVMSSRIPNDCMVAQPNWGSWRALHQIREVARAGRRFSWEDEAELCPGVPQEFVRRARDAGEALLFAMHAAVTATRATAGLVHRVRKPFVGLVTSSARGPRIDDQLGQVVPRLDPAFRLATEGKMLMGSLAQDEVGGPERAIARRFSACPGQLQGVAMVPVFDGGRLLAMIEIARADHPFRGEDGAVLLKIAAVVCAR
jgi:hypothetical protein